MERPVIGEAIGVALTVALQIANGMVPAGMADMDIGQAAVADTTGMAAMHQHPPRDVAEGAPVHGVRHLVFPDAIVGYNVQNLPRKFTDGPAAINREVQDNEGHI